MANSFMPPLEKCPFCGIPHRVLVQRVTQGVRTLLEYRCDACQLKWRTLEDGTFIEMPKQADRAKH
jgi:hypothetical protein